MCSTGACPGRWHAPNAALQNCHQIERISLARLDADGSADLTVPELKQMRDHPDIRMPEASMAGIRLPYFAATFADRMRDDVDTTEVFETLDADKNGVLTRKETRAAKQFFKGELR